jgi:hypothetical protein
VRAVGVDMWHEIVDNYLALPTSHSPVVCQWKVPIGMAILEHEDMERCLHTLGGLRHCLVRGFSLDFGGGFGRRGGGWRSALHEALSLRFAAKILECCASTDSRTGEGWMILRALFVASEGEGDDEKTVSIVNLIHAQQHVLVAALQHPSMNVRLAALQCASTVAAAASFPRTDRLAMMDVLVRGLRDMREETQAAAVPHPSKPREYEYSDEFEAVATLWRFDEGEDRWTGGAKGTVKVLTHRLLADNILFIFRDANRKLMAYHPFTPDTQLVKVDDATWEWRAEKDYADDDEGFAEQFRLSLQSSERDSRFQHYITRSNRQLTPAPGTTAPPPGVAVEDEFFATAQKAFGSYSVASRQTFVDAVLHAAIHGPAKNVKRRTSDDRSRFDEAYRLIALTALHTWCESDVTSEPVACCPTAQRLVDNGGAMEVALVAIAYYDPIPRAVSNGRVAALDTSSDVGCYVMILLQKHVRHGAMREALGEDLYTAVAALVTLINSTSTLRN